MSKRTKSGKFAVVVACAAVWTGWSASSVAQPRSARDFLEQRRAGLEPKLQALRDQLAERGVPMSLDDYATMIEAAPDATNPAPAIIAAGKLLPPQLPDLDRDADLLRLPGEPEAVLPELPPDQLPVMSWADIEQMTADVAPALEALAAIDPHIRPNVKLVEADFGLNIRDVENGLAINVLLPELSNARNLA
ncbi:MAG: hypothetical protein AAGK78_13750, partial [Planctomycetota bacterium]